MYLTTVRIGIIVHWHKSLMNDLMDLCYYTFEVHVHVYCRTSFVKGKEVGTKVTVRGYAQIYVVLNLQF